MKLFVFSTHPDDAESGCAGLIINCAQAGHPVVIVHCTPGRHERQINHEPEMDVRRREAQAAAQVMGVQVEVLDYPHGTLASTPEHKKHFREVFLKHRPDVFITQWPVDTHPDHRDVGILSLDIFQESQWNIQFYFYEVFTGLQSLHFHPTHYIDISETYVKKKEAIFCHQSQKPDKIWETNEIMHKFRGMEAGVERAEGFIKLERKGTVGKLLPELRKN